MGWSEAWRELEEVGQRTVAGEGIGRKGYRDDGDEDDMEAWALVLDDVVEALL